MICITVEYRIGISICYCYCYVCHSTVRGSPERRKPWGENYRNIKYRTLIHRYDSQTRTGDWYVLVLAIVSKPSYDVSSMFAIRQCVVLFQKILRKQIAKNFPDQKRSSIILHDKSKTDVTHMKTTTVLNIKLRCMILRCMILRSMI